MRGRDLTPRQRRERQPGEPAPAARTRSSPDAPTRTSGVHASVPDERQARSRRSRRPSPSRATSPPAVAAIRPSPSLRRNHHRPRPARIGLSTMNARRPSPHPRTPTTAASSAGRATRTAASAANGVPASSNGFHSGTWPLRERAPEEAGAREPHGQDVGVLVRQPRQEGEPAEGDQDGDDDQARARRPPRGTVRSARAPGRLPVRPPAASGARIAVSIGRSRLPVRRFVPVAAGRLLDSAAVRPLLPPESPSMISLQHVTKVYRNGTTALEDVTRRGREGRVRLHRRPVRFGQVDVHPAPAQGRGRDEGRHLRRRQEPREAHRLEDPAPAPQHRHRVPGLQAARRQDGVRERRRSRSR